MISESFTTVLEMALKSGIFAFHLIAFLIDIFSFLYDFMLVEDSHQGFGGKFRFLTVWCLILQTIYFGLSAVVDLIEKEPSTGNTFQRTDLQKLRDRFHGVIVFPVTVFVSALFWTLYAVDRELIHPKNLDGRLPFWLTHAHHTSILPFIIVDKLLVCHVYPRRLYGILGICGFTLLYLIWILLVAYVDDFWVYPVLRYMNAHERATFFAVCAIFPSSFYVLGDCLTKSIWGKKAVGIKKVS